MANLKKQAFREWLVIRSQQGEVTAFTALVEQWHGRYLAYAKGRLQDREAALDVTQEAWLSISRNLGGLKDPAAYPAWSLRILERRCADWLRKTCREREQLPVDPDAPEPGKEDSGACTLDARNLIAGLDPRLATVLRLYYLEELTLGEIAQILDIPVGTVKSRLFYARQLISDTVEKQI